MEPISSSGTLACSRFSTPVECRGLTGVRPKALCGHSFGEWAALAVSGAITLEAGIKIVSGYVFLGVSSDPQPLC